MRKALLVVLSMAAMTGCGVGDGSSLDRSELTDADRQALAMIGVSDVEFARSGALLRDAAGREIGSITLSDDGSRVARLDGAEARIAIDGPVECNGAGLTGIQASLAADLLAPCKAALVAHEVIYGKGVLATDSGQARSALLAAGDTVCGVSCVTESVSVFIDSGGNWWVTHHCAPGSGAVAVTHSIGSNCHNFD